MVARRPLGQRQPDNGRGGQPDRADALLPIRGDTLGTLPTDRRFTGQLELAGLGIYDYGARAYSPLLGRFLSADTIVPQPGNPQAFNRYSYGWNNPVKYVDSSGHIAFIPLLIAGGVLLLKAIDYGVTAYDAYQSGQTIADPNASSEDKLLSGLNIALSVSLEAVEPDDALPVGVPIDDVGRKLLMGQAKRAVKEGGTEGLIKTVRNTLGNSADDVLRAAGVKLDDYTWRFEKMMKRRQLPDHRLHHGFPKAAEFADFFKRVGIDVHDPNHLFELPFDIHTKVHTGKNGTNWNGRWRKWMEENPNATLEQIYYFRDQLAREFGIESFLVK